METPDEPECGNSGRCRFPFSCFCLLFCFLFLPVRDSVILILNGQLVTVIIMKRTKTKDSCYNSMETKIKKEFRCVFAFLFEVASVHPSHLTNWHKMAPGTWNYADRQNVSHFIISDLFRRISGTLQATTRESDPGRPSSWLLLKLFLNSSLLSW